MLLRTFIVSASCLISFLFLVCWHMLLYLDTHQPSKTRFVSQCHTRLDFLDRTDDFQSGNLALKQYSSQGVNSDHDDHPKVVAIR